MHSLNIQPFKIHQIFSLACDWSTLTPRIGKYCLISASYLVGLFDIFILRRIWQNRVCFGEFLPMRTPCDAYHTELNILVLNLRVYGNWRCHAKYQQIVANRGDLYLLAINTEKYWTLSLCCNFGCSYKNADSSGASYRVGPEGLAFLKKTQDRLRFSKRARSNPNSHPSFWGCFVGFVAW